MTARGRTKQKMRVLAAQEYLNGLNRFAFAALLTALDDRNELEPIEREPWGKDPPREPTAWEKIKEFLFGSEDAESS